MVVSVTLRGKPKVHEKPVAPAAPAGEGEGKGEGEGEGEAEADAPAEEEAAPFLKAYTVTFKLFGVAEEGTLQFEDAGEGAELEASLDVPLQVNETLVRDMVAAGASTVFEVTQGEESGQIDMDGTTAMLVGDRHAAARFPSRGRPLPEVLRDFEALSLEVTLFEEAPAAEAAEAEEDAPPPPPRVKTQLLPEGLRLSLNPIIVHIGSCLTLPDQPATMKQLDEDCEPVWLTYHFPCADAEVKHEGQASKWDVSGDDFPSTRDVHFDSTDIYLSGDMPVEELFESFKSKKLEVQIHDRTALPEESQLPQDEDDDEGDGGEGGESGEGGEGDGEATQEDADVAAFLAAGDDGAVYGLAKLDVKELCRKGQRKLEVEANICPATTIRGGGDLEWKTRPGRYMEANSLLNVSVRACVPLEETVVHCPYVRTVFVMDYKDNEMLHTIRNVVRSTNAHALQLHGTEAHILQTLVTYKFDEEQEKDPGLDILTGFELIDTEKRLIVVEGLKERAMREITEVAESFVGTQASRRILNNNRLAYRNRLYASLGADLKPIKLRNPLSSIVSDASTYATGKVRDQCKAGLNRLAKLSEVLWLRQVDRMQLLPTNVMLNYIDKKFGGELTKDDIQGFSESKNQRSGLSLDRGTGHSQGSMEESGNLESGPVVHGSPTRAKKQSLKPQVDPLNKVYLQEVETRKAIRDQRDFHAEYLMELETMKEYSENIKAEWHTWNPQREVLKRIERGELDNLTNGEYEFEIVKGKTKVDKGSKLADSDAFVWPVPKEPRQYIEHPKRPNAARIEELQQPWIENEYNQGPVGREEEQFAVPFKTIMPAPALFEPTPPSVHLVGDGLIRELKEAKQREIDLWDSKVVVDNIHFHATFKNRKKVSQTDRHEITLKDKPVKTGFKIAHVEPIRKSMFLDAKFEEADKEVLLRKPTKENWVTQKAAGPGMEPRDFQRLIHQDTGSLHWRRRA